jgi:16S rRNA G527 N7-methylase RsmG
VWPHVRHNQQGQGNSWGHRHGLWESCSPFCKTDPHRTDDVEFERLTQGVNPTTTLLDVGAGAGRFALPLALRCKHVTAVEPPPSMGETLRHLAAEAGIANVTLVASPWDEAEVEPTDKAQFATGCGRRLNWP